MKAGKKMMRICSILAVLPLTMAALCGDKIPVREMSVAKLEISKALSVKADKYAPVELEAANKALYQSHEFIRDDDLSKAKDSAVLSFNQAQAAYEKSLPLLAKDTIEIAEKSMNDADEANASELAKEEYAQAKDALKSATDQFENKKYYESYMAAIEADKLAKNARNSAIGRKDVLADAIAEVNTTITEAKKYNAERYAPEKLKSAEDNLKTASDSLNALQLKKGFAAAEAAKISADEAYLEALKGYAADEIAAAEVLMDKAGQSEGASMAKDDLAAAKESIANAKTAYAEARYREAIAAAAEAKRLSSLVIATKKVQPGDRTGDVKLAGTGDKDAGKKGGDIAGDRGKKGGLTAEELGYKIYKVRYIPERRDCLWRISDKFYSNPWKWRRIFEANRDQIDNPNLIHPGQLLKIPVKKKAVEKNIEQDVRKEDEVAPESTLKPLEEKIEDSTTEEPQL